MQIKQAESSLVEMLGVDDLVDKTFLDVGSGSGLFSLAARNLGAKVTSFDFDENSVWCTAELKSRFHPEDDKWKVLQGSVLDSDFLSTLDNFDYVYSWGVLHHTGNMWEGLIQTFSVPVPEDKKKADRDEDARPAKVGRIDPGSPSLTYECSS